MNKLIVKCNDMIVGTLALTKNKMIAFQYSDEWIRNGFSISPFSLPLSDKIFIPTKHYFNGLFGVFADSLPDSWGNRLLDRMLISHNVSRDDVDVLTRLSYIGNNGMGLLSYEPETNINININGLSLDEINDECERILSSKESYNLDELYALGGSSGGARPKALINYNGRPWIVKFSNTIDSKYSGVIEYRYFECAKKCGINVPNTKLFESKINPGYFGIERFDVENGRRIHMITVAGLLELDFRSPCLDYKDLIKLTKIMTNDKDTYEMYRRMCFNVFSHNQDDHAKNFTFLYDMKDNAWKLSPAYDLTYSNTYFNEHTTSVNGVGKNIKESDLLSVGLINGLNKAKCISIIKEIKECVSDMLKDILNNPNLL